jgi:uncharacterized protein YkwD
MGFAHRPRRSQARVRRGIAALLALTTAWLLAPGSAGDAHASRVTPETHMRALINAERESRDLGTLHSGRRLAQVALRQSRDMASAGRIFHNPRLHRVYSRLGCSILGENVGAAEIATDVIQAIEALHQAFLSSPSHRRNLLRPRYRRVGIGTVESGGRVWISVLFMA